MKKTYKVTESNIEYEIEEYASGTKHWYHKGQHHRIGGPAYEGIDGTKYWYHKGQLHRTNGPAVEWLNGIKSWYHKGQRHRIDGPAIEGANGAKKWYINDKELTEQQFKRYQTYMTLLSKATTQSQRESAQLLLNTIINFNQEKKNKK
jgi:hypothetical protein